MARYDKLSMALHWSIAVLALGQMALGWWMVGLADSSGVQRGWFNLHKSLGLTIGALMLARLAWRAAHPPPPLPQGLALWEERAACASHRLLYAVLIAQPVVGYLGSSFSAYPIRYFGLALPAWGWHSPALKAFFGGLHFAFACVLSVLIALHIAAALRHRMKGDGVFDRMWHRSHRALRRGPLTSPE